MCIRYRIFTALTAGHFMSQILAEQLRNNRKTAAPPTGGPLRSFVNLHMDAGTLCWIYIFLGFGPLFVVVCTPCCCSPTPPRFWCLCAASTSACPPPPSKEKDQ